MCAKSGLSMTHDTRRTRAVPASPKGSAELLLECRLRLAEAEAEVERLRAVMDLAKQINTELDTEKVLDGAMKAAVKLTGAERGYLVLTDDGGEQTVRASYQFDRNMVDDRDVTYSHSVVLEAICSGEPILSTNAAEDERFANAASVMTNDLRAVMAAPIRDVGGEPIGAFYVDDPFRSGRFNRQALKLLEGFADQASAAVRTARLHGHLLREKERALQMSMARLVQRKLIPQQAPEVEGVEMAWTYRPAQEVGGDIVQFLSLPGGECGVFIADVAGKGVPAALVMAKIHQACKMISKVWSGPKAFMAELNDTLREDFDVGTFVTAAIAVFGPSGDTVRIVRAGHCPLGLIRAGQASFEWLLPDGIALGIMKTAGREFGAEEVVLSLEPGDGLLLYTDGVTEAHCPRKTEYGEERITAFAERSIAAHPSDFVRKLVGDIQAFVGDAEQHDDVTILYARREAEDRTLVLSAPAPLEPGEREVSGEDPASSDPEAAEASDVSPAASDSKEEDASDESPASPDPAVSDSEAAEASDASSAASDSKEADPSDESPASPDPAASDPKAGEAPDVSPAFSGPKEREAPGEHWPLADPIPSRSVPSRSVPSGPAALGSGGREASDESGGVAGPVPLGSEKRGASGEHRTIARPARREAIPRRDRPRRDGSRILFDESPCDDVAARTEGEGSEAEAHPDA